VTAFARSSIVLLSFLAVCVLPACAQEEEAPPRQKACVVFPVQDLSTRAETAEFAPPITASISAAIEAGGYGMIPPETWEPEAQKSGLAPRALLGEAVALSVARALNADLAVSGYYVVQEGQVFISLQCWDVPRGMLVTGMQEKARFNLAFYSFLHDRVAAMLQRIQPRELPEAAAALGAAPAVTLGEISFLSPDEGMEVRLAGDVSIGTIADGRLLWKADGIGRGAELLVEKRKPGYHTSFQAVRALGEIRLSRLEKIYSHTVEVGWTWGQLVGIGAAYRLYTQPDSLFFFFAAYPFVQPPLTAAGSPIFHADFSLGVGGYLFFPPDFPVRLGISGGAGVIATIPVSPALRPAADWYLNVINWWLETNFLGPVIFLRQEWKFTLGAGDNYLGTNWIMPAHIPPMTLGVMFRW
jgi:hypothetical protein